MSKRKMVQSNLIKNSIAAYFGAVEIHNKPNISYRYETTTLLMMNAWELILKAYVKKYIKKQSIYTKDGHTISLDKAIGYVDEHINKTSPKAFAAIKQNLLLMETYRNNIVHYYNEQLEPYVFMLTAKAALNYVEFVKKHFHKDILAEDGLFILPLGFKLPFKPEDFLSKKATQYISSSESRSFIESMVHIITDLSEQGVEDTIVVGFDIYLENVKKLNNHDLLVAITSKAEDADAKFAKVSKVQISNNPDAQKVSISDDELMKQYPLQYADVSAECKKRIPGFKRNRIFNDKIKALKSNPQYAFERRLNPKSMGSSKVTLYSEAAVDEIVRLYEEDT